MSKILATDRTPSEPVKKGMNTTTVVLIVVIVVVIIIAAFVIMKQRKQLKALKILPSNV